jgi:ArsR family transcriptional regulator, lead/cadmium/zinc/bismuth-responsive transcriptional repressor
MPDYSAKKLITEPLEDGEELCCEVPHSHHSDAANPASPEILTVEKAQRMSEFLGFLADTNRLRILSLLANQEMCVGDLAIALEMNESAVSHQLRTLRAIRLVSFRKQGRHVFYRLQDHHVLDFYEAIVEHLDEATM